MLSTKGVIELEKILDFCTRANISRATYYKICNQLGHRPTLEEVKARHKRLQIYKGRPRKDFNKGEK